MTFKLYKTLPLILLCVVSACQQSLPTTPTNVGNRATVTLPDRDVFVTRTRDAVVIFPTAASAPAGVNVNVVGPRGQGGPAIVVSGTAIGERAIAEYAMLSACAPDAPNVAAARAQIVDYNADIARYDSSTGEAIFSVGGCPGLDGGL